MATQQINTNEQMFDNVSPTNQLKIEPECFHVMSTPFKAPIIPLPLKTAYQTYKDDIILFTPGVDQRGGSDMQMSDYSLSTGITPAIQNMAIACNEMDITPGPFIQKQLQQTSGNEKEEEMNGVVKKSSPMETILSPPPTLSTNLFENLHHHNQFSPFEMFDKLKDILLKFVKIGSEPKILIPQTPEKRKIIFEDDEIKPPALVFDTPIKSSSSSKITQEGKLLLETAKKFEKENKLAESMNCYIAVLHFDNFSLQE